MMKNFMIIYFPVLIPLVFIFFVDYSSTEFKTDDFAPGKMDIQSIGLQLEADIYDDETDTRAFVSSNLSSQVDGEEDSIIVVAFRGTASSTNVKTDFNFNQVSFIYI